MTTNERIADALQSLAVSFALIIQLIEEAKKQDEQDDSQTDIEERRLF